jgi:ADP-heptose:LPS heptosyltransferase
MGNTVLMLPVIEQLARYFHKPIDVLIDERYADLLQLLPVAATTLSYPTQERRTKTAAATVRALTMPVSVLAKRYDTVFNLVEGVRAWTLALASWSRQRIGYTDQLRPWLYDFAAERGGLVHYYDRYAAILQSIGSHAIPPWPRYFAPSRARASIDALLSDLHVPRDAALAVIHPGAGRPGRRWPPERFGKVARALSEDAGMRICVIGPPSERGLMDGVRAEMGRPDDALLMSLPLLDLFALFERAAILVSNESGPTHLATMTPIPIVTVFGPAKETAWRPVRKERLTIIRGADCDPRCGKRQCFAGLRCLERATPEIVTAAAKALLQ